MAAILDARASSPSTVLRNELDSRFRKVVGLSALFYYLFFWWWSLSFSDFPLGMIKKLVNPVYILFYSIPFGLSLPILWATRSSYNIKVHRKTQQNLLLSLTHFIDKGEAKAIMWYTLSSIAIGAMYFSQHGESRFHNILLLYPYGQLNNPQLNASAVYLAWFSILLGPAYALVRRYRERDVFAFPLQRRKSKFYTIKSRLANTLKTSLVFTVKYIVAFALLHFVFGGAFFRVASTFAAPLVRGGLLKRNEYASAWIDLWSLIYVFGCGLLTVSAWEMSSQIFEAFFMEPVTMSDWDQSLKFFFNKLQDGQQAYYQQLAFLELWQLTRYDAKKRSYILNHLEADPVKPWHSMANACTAVINDFSTVLEDDVAPSKATPKGDDLPNLRSAIPARAPPSSSVRHENIMSPPKKQTFLQSAYSKLLDEDQAPKTTQRAYLRAGNAAPAPRTNSAYGNIPDLLRPSAPVVDANGLRSVGAEKRKGVAVKKGVNASGLVVKGLEKVKWGRWVVEMGRRYWGESLERRTARVFENATVVTWAVRALSSIVVASATEDRFGTVSQDLGPLLECLLRCLIALEEYSVRVGNQMRRRSHSSNGRLGRQVVARSNLMMINELQTCIYAITNKFRDHLKDKKFRDPYAERLQGFVDFRE